MTSYTLADRLAAYFSARPGTWIDGRVLAGVAGGYAWRTRISELRRAPFHFDIENRQRRLRTPDGQRFVVSEYRYRPALLALTDVRPNEEVLFARCR